MAVEPAPALTGWRIAAPMVGGVVTSVLMELLVYPAIYFLWRGRQLRREARSAGQVLVD